MGGRGDFPEIVKYNRRGTLRGRASKSEGGKERGREGE
jgi:hypothetical protein